MSQAKRSFWDPQNDPKTETCLSNEREARYNSNKSVLCVSVCVFVCERLCVCVSVCLCDCFCVIVSAQHFRHSSAAAFGGGLVDPLPGWILNAFNNSNSSVLCVSVCVFVCECLCVCVYVCLCECFWVAVSAQQFRHSSAAAFGGGLVDQLLVWILNAFNNSNSSVLCVCVSVCLCASVCASLRLCVYVFVSASLCLPSISVTPRPPPSAAASSIRCQYGF